MSGHTPGPPHVCGTPDAMCDTECMGKASEWPMCEADCDRMERAAIAIELLTEQRDALLALARQYASECGECSGRGTFPSHREDPGGHSVLECWECEDIRAVIAKATV